MICSVVITGCVKGKASSCTTDIAGSTAHDTYAVTMKQDLLCLMAGYPDYITGLYIDGKDVYVEMKSGKRILYDDRKEKSIAEKLENPDLQDTLEQVYPLSEISELSKTSFDPGRARNYELFKEVYGSTRKDVEKNLVSVPVGSGCCRFNSNNGAALKLREAFRELHLLGRRNPSIYSYISPMGGTFNYRYISGTNRLSAHSFGTAIDLAVHRHDYWKWATREQGQKRIAGYPMEVVSAFEKHGFIWGGKWGHFDIMHYEYRPEIILKARYFSGKMGHGEKWYGNIERYDDGIIAYINLIEKSF